MHLKLSTALIGLAAIGQWATPAMGGPPELRREFRAAWVATVANIDWPSRKGLSTEVQKKELVAILDRCVDLKLNAVVLQVRPMCDALYKSDLEPWSEFLTGTMGQAPMPYYDPLEFAVAEAHARGLELHTWFNPYRAHQPAGRSPIAGNHIVAQRPDLAPKYGKHFWMVPTEPEVIDRSLAVFLDVVRRYDVDGIHMDDYFYPYAEKDEAGKTIPFPDDESWRKYQSGGGTLGRSDWRRDAVNRFVERLYVETKKLKPWVKVGISPFGIWKPGHPPGIEGFNQYEGLYADAKLWFNKGWVDYFTPQLYWPIDPPKQSYPKLLAWWASENAAQRHLWPGNSAGRAAGRGANELERQIELTRQLGGGGNVFFSMKSLQRNRNVEAALRKAYAEPALVPPSPWLQDKAASKAPQSLTLLRRVPAELAVEFSDASTVAWVVVQAKVDGKWSATTHFVAKRKSATMPVPATAEQLRALAFDRANVLVATADLQAGGAGQN